MLDPKHFEIIGGHMVVELMRDRREMLTDPRVRLPVGARTLTDVQRIEAEAGVRGAEIEHFPTAGWIVHSDSGLQDWQGLASIHLGNVDGSYDDAVRWATEWQAEDPTHRYVWRRK